MRAQTAPDRTITFTVTVIVFSALAVIWGLLTGSISVNGQVLTDDVNAAWFGGSCNTGSGPSGAPPVAVTTFTPPTADTATLAFAATNTYPGYSVECTARFANTGAMPVVVRGAALDPLATDAIRVELVSPPLGVQLEPCRGVPAWNTEPASLPSGCHAAQTFRLSITDTALQNTRYQFAVRLCVAQWSVSTTPAECFAGIATPPGSSTPAPVVPPAPLTPAPGTGGTEPAPNPVVAPPPVNPPPAVAPPATLPTEPATGSGATGNQGAAVAASPTVEVLPLTPAPAAATPAVEVLPLTPPPATATATPPALALNVAQTTPTPTPTSARTATPTAAATSTAVRTVTPAVTASAPAATPAPAVPAANPAPRLPNAGSGGVTQVDDIGMGTLSATLALAGGLYGLVVLLRRKGTRSAERETRNAGDS